MPDEKRKKPSIRLRRTAGNKLFDGKEDLVDLLGVLPDVAVAQKAGSKRLTGGSRFCDRRGPFPA